MTLQPPDQTSQQALEEATRVAHRYLTYGPRSTQDVRMRLERADVPFKLINQIVAHLSESGILDDAAYAKDYVMARFRHKSYGPQRLRTELRRHGIPESMIKQALTQITPDVIAHRAGELAKQFWPRTHGSQLMRRRKVRDYLLRRGYSSSEAMAAIRQLPHGST